MKDKYVKTDVFTVATIKEKMIEKHNIEFKDFDITTLFKLIDASEKLSHEQPKLMSISKAINNSNVLNSIYIIKTDRDLKSHYGSASLDGIYSIDNAYLSSLKRLCHCIRIWGDKRNLTKWTDKFCDSYSSDIMLLNNSIQKVYSDENELIKDAETLGNIKSEFQQLSYFNMLLKKYRNKYVECGKDFKNLYNHFIDLCIEKGFESATEYRYEKLMNKNN